MSTKTTFKRIALVAVAALGLGVLSVAPSSATVSGLTWSVTNGTATAKSADSRTAATISISALLDNTTDSVTVSFVKKSFLDVNGAASTESRTGYLNYQETTTGSSTTAQASLLGSASALNGVKGRTLAQYNAESVTAGTTLALTNTGVAGYANAKFRLQIESSTATVAGTYTWTVIVKTYHGTSASVTTDTKDVSITVAALATASKTASAVYSTAVLAAGSASPAYSAVDEVVSAPSTASGSAAATVAVHLFNAEGPSNYAQESITATITGPGTIGLRGGTFGKSVVIQSSQAVNYLDVRADGTAGVATINVSTPSVTFAPKTVTFYAKSPKTITASVNNPVLALGDNSTAVVASAVDANGTAWVGGLYIVASAAADALIGGSATEPVACEWNGTYKVYYCPISTIAAGTASFKVVDESLDTDAVYAAADSAASSAAVSVTVSAATAASVKLAFDKATYAPFEKAVITVTPLDKDGKTLQGARYTGLLATGGITGNYAFSAGSDTLTAIELYTASANSTTTTAGAKSYVVYMPASGDITISATGGTNLPVAGQVKVTASASVVNSSVDAATDAANEATDAANAATDAALAAADAADAATAAAQDASDAVAALSATVAKLVASLKAQITSLTNLVIKIQKKVRA